MKISKRQLRRIIKEELEEGIMDNIKGFFTKNKPEKETEEPFDQEAALESLSDKLQDRFFRKSFITALFFYYMLGDGEDHYRSGEAKNFLRLDHVLNGMKEIGNLYGIKDRAAAMQWLNMSLSKSDQSTIAHYILTNKTEEILDMPGLYDYVFAKFDRSRAADFLVDRYGR